MIINDVKPKSVAIVCMTMLSAALDLLISYGTYKGEYEVKYFCDIYNNSIGENFNGKEVVNLSKLKQDYDNNDIDVILVESSNAGVLPFKLLKDIGIDDKVYIVPPWFYDGAFDYVAVTEFKQTDEVPLSEALIKADMNKAVLDFIGLFTNYHCNYSCKSCITASPLAEVGFTTLESFVNDIKRLSEIYWHITRIRITGGEALLHPDLIEIAKIARKAFPGAGIAIQTNALMLLKKDNGLKDLYKTMRENNIGFQISVYKPIYEKRDILREELQSNGIQWSWGQISCEVVEYFDVWRELTPKNDEKEQYAICRSMKNCHILLDGYVYPCIMQMTSKNIEKYFSVEFEGFEEAMPKMRQNIYDTKMDGWELTEFLSSPNFACKYCCINEQKNVKWEQYSAKNSKLSDYVLK
ncbi:MAG: hypothetical protein LBC73_03015 [Oscillospiraceae bacterium]|jgi:hypothetical protein|nr:hypothetical protein [Oscillospiraceae bacterium]